MMTENSGQQEEFEAFYQGHTGHAVILLPGLCGSELEMGAIPRLLKQSGHTVAIPRIPGYSAHTGITNYSEWIESVDVVAQNLLKSQSMPLRDPLRFAFSKIAPHWEGCI